MSPQSSCYGVMLDRNFDVEWNASHGISPCSHVYPGPTPFSEPETRAVRDVLHLYSQKIVAYIHVHASTYGASIFKVSRLDLIFNDHSMIVQRFMTIAKGILTWIKEGIQG